jgi:hypothetical protein
MFSNTPWFRQAPKDPTFEGLPIFEKKTAKRRLRPGSSETQVVLPYWQDILPRLPADVVALVDKHDTTSFGYRKPDIVGYLSGKPQSVDNIALLGELKARRAKGSDKFSDTEKGQLASFLEEVLLNYQQWRHDITGFLTDGYLVQFFQFLRGGILHEGPVLYLHKDGGRWLTGLLQQMAYNGLAIKIDKKPVEVGEYLGHGGSAVVFSGRWKGTSTACRFSYE